MIKIFYLISSLLLFSAGSFAKDSSCKTDKQKFCSHCEKGQKECVKKCMKKHKSELSKECKAQRKKGRDPQSVKEGYLSPEKVNNRPENQISP